jgi:hypothetical protein
MKVETLRKILNIEEGSSETVKCAGSIKIIMKGTKGGDAYDNIRGCSIKGDLLILDFEEDRHYKEGCFEIQEITAVLHKLFF